MPSFLLPSLPLPSLLLPTLPTPPKNGCRIFRLPSFLLPTLPLPSLSFTQKIAPFYFCNNFVESHCIFDKFWHTATEVNLQQNCSKIAHLTWWLFSLYLVERNISQCVDNNSNVCFKSHDSYRETRHSKCWYCLFFGFETHIKTMSSLIKGWSTKLCWLLTMFHIILDAISHHWHPSLVSDNNVPTYQLWSMSPRSVALVWFSCSQGWKWMVHITVMSCCSNICWRLLLSNASCMHKSTELLEHKTPDFTPDMPWPPNRPVLTVDYRIWTVIQECVCQKQQGMSNCG